MSRVFLFLYTGYYSDIFYPVLGVKHRDSSGPPRGSDTLLVDSDGPAPIAAKNLDVYFCAKTLAIKPLQAFAVTKLDKHCRDEVKSPDFPATLSYILDHTTSADLELRMTLVYICLENSAFATRSADIVALLEQHEPVAWRLSTKVLMKSLELLPVEKGSEPEKQADADGVKMGKKRNEQHVSKDRLLALEGQLQEAKSKASDAESRLHKANSSQHAWGAMKRANKGLQAEVTALNAEVTKLKNSLEEAQTRVKDCKSCHVCHRQFFVLLKVDLPKGDIWVKCRSCGGNHR